jgi:ABC-type glutathione transport system ATPase component
MLIRAAAGRMRNVIRAPFADRDLAHGHLIDLREVVKDYVTDAGPFRALKSVSLQVDAGEFIAVVGRSGSGKSTLMNMITGIDRPRSSWAGPACPAWARAAWRSGEAARWA